jgi:integrase
MSLRRLRNSPYWIACLTLPDGKRTNRSTKTANRKLAQRLANEWQTAAAKAREGAFVEAQARKVLNEILSHVGQDSLPHETAESFFRQWMTGKGEGNTARRYASTVEKFLESIGHKRHARLDAIGHQEVLNFIATRDEEGVAPKTLVVDVRTIGAAFNVARKLGLITFNPVERALTIRPIAAESSHRGIFSEEQVATLINAAQGEWKTLILLGYYTGARLGDCAKMQWGCVDFARGVIDFVPEKTRRKNKRVVVPLHPILLAHLQALSMSAEPATFLCPNLAKKRTGGKNGLSALFRRMMDGAAIDSQTSQGLGVRQFSKLSFHALRHSFTSGLANAGVTPELRMKLTGHSSEAVHRGYTHHELEVLKSAVTKLPSLG